MTVNDSRKWITIARVFAPEHRHDSLSVHVCACPNPATIDLFAMKMAINNLSVETSSTLGPVHMHTFTYVSKVTCVSNSTYGVM